MAYIITDPCISTCDTACVEACPVDCIHGPDSTTGSGEEVKEEGYDIEGKQLYIDADTCIDCDACVPVCPVEAIFPEEDVPDEYQDSIRRNYEFFGLTPP